MSSNSTNSENKLVVVSAPSGAGKTTLVQYLLLEIPELQFSVSCTTRKARPHEEHGRDYYFISVDEFKNRIDDSSFVEFEQVYEGLYYGTLKEEVDRILDSGKHVIFDIDVQGGMNIKKQYPFALSIFISPPSKKSLQERLEKRDTESVEDLAMRVAKAEKEMKFKDQFDVVIVNDDLNAAKREIKKVVLEYLHN